MHRCSVTIKGQPSLKEARHLPPLPHTRSHTTSYVSHGSDFLEGYQADECGLTVPKADRPWSFSWLQLVHTETCFCGDFFVESYLIFVFICLLWILSFFYLFSRIHMCVLYDKAFPGKSPHTHTCPLIPDREHTTKGQMPPSRLLRIGVAYRS